MIAAVGRRIRAATAKLDRTVNRQLQRTWPRLAKTGRAAQARGRRLGHRLRPAGVLLLRGLALLERWLLRGATRARRAATRLSAVLTPQRAICLTILGAAACLIAAQFVDYRAVEIDQLGYAGLPAASAPTVDAKTAGQAHAFLLIPVALLAAFLALVALRNEGRRGLGRVVFVLGLISLAVVLLVDLPAGLDAGVQSSRFAGAKAVLYDDFYAQIAAAAGLMLGGALLSRARKPRLARTQGGRRSARTLFVRKQGGRPRTQPDEGLQRPAATMRGRAKHEPTNSQGPQAA
ncbi:MAG TPA: hypothetical protein VK471_10780 [Solirubrobacterales bacterium]|nr:hypothetical protein [Solirubrobacterales bacterium]